MERFINKNMSDHSNTWIPTITISTKHRPAFTCSSYQQYLVISYNMTSDPFKPARFSQPCPCSGSLDGCMCHWALPGGNEVLGQVDAHWCSCDSDMAITCPIQLAPDFNLSSWHLPDLVDLSTLTTNDRANQLQEDRVKTDQVSLMEKLISM